MSKAMGDSASETVNRSIRGGGLLDCFGAAFDYLE